MFPTTYRYAAVTPDLPKSLGPDEALAHVREYVFYYFHQAAFWKARATALEARLAALETPTLPE